MDTMDTTDQSFQGPSPNTLNHPPSLKRDSPTPATSFPPSIIDVSSDVDDDVTSSVPHTDVSSAGDITWTNDAVHEIPNGDDDEENAPDVVDLAASDTASRPQIQDGVHDPRHDSSHSDDALDANGGDDILQHAPQTERACPKGSEVEVEVEVKVKDISVVDLAPQLPTLAVSKVKAVPVSRRFYNQWARAPRWDDPEGDVTSGARTKPLSMRMLTVTGSLKSYTLMRAIVRDKGSPIHSLTDLVQTRYTSSPPERTRDRNDDDDDTATAANTALGRSLSDTALAKVARQTTAEWATRDQQTQTFPPISDPRAKTAPHAGKLDDDDDDDDNAADAGGGGGGGGGGFPGEFVRKSRSQLSSSTVSCSSFSFDRLPGSAEMKKRPMSQLNPRNLCSSSSSSFCCSSSSGSGSFPASPVLLRPVQTLSMNTASLLFASTVDMREQYYQQLIQKHPRGLVIKATRNSDPREKTLKPGAPPLPPPPPLLPQACSDAGPESSGSRRLEAATRVEFIDFSQVTRASLRGGVVGKAGERWSGKKKTAAGGAGGGAGGGGGGGGGDAVGGRPATASKKRPLLSEAESARQGVSCTRRNNARQFLTVGMTVPIHALAE